MESPFSEAEIKESLLKFHQDSALRYEHLYDETKIKYEQLEDRFTKEDCSDDLIKSFELLDLYWKRQKFHEKQVLRISQNM